MRDVVVRLTRFAVCAALLGSVLGVGPLGRSVARADDPAAAPEGDPLARFAWQREGTGKLGGQGQIAIPAGFRFIPAAEASRLIEEMGNLTSKKELGLIGAEDMSWFVVFFFDDVGYVKDDEKDELDADAMAKSIREGLVESNETRRARGMTELDFDGWAIPPRYNDQSKQLEWAQRLKSVDGVSVNYNTRVLGRHGVMRVILVCDPEALDGTLPSYRQLMGGFAFVDGEDYAAYRDGDRIAEFGLAALIVGGGAAVAVKTGLLSAAFLFFKKGAKVIVLGVMALLAGIKKFFSGKKDGDVPT